MRLEMIEKTARDFKRLKFRIQFIKLLACFLYRLLILGGASRNGKTIAESTQNDNEW
jgi:hypothetical protein